MADKITNFEDYVKRESGQEEPLKQEEAVKREETSEQPADVKREEASEQKEAQEQPAEPKKPGDETLTAMEIRIEDPENFFNEAEREEYIKARQEESRAERRQESEPPKRREESRREEAGPATPRREDARRDEKRPAPPRREEARRPQPEDDYEDDYDEEYEDEDDGGVNMDLVVRVASIITGIIILAFIAFAVKVKVIDKQFARDPDEEQTVVSNLALPEGFIEKNDTVTVTGAELLNLRSGPGTDSEVMGIVPQGDILKRIAVNSDNTWALVEVEGQQYYVSMKYLKEN